MRSPPGVARSLCGGATLSKALRSPAPCPRLRLGACFVLGPVRRTVMSSAPSSSATAATTTTTATRIESRVDDHKDRVQSKIQHVRQRMQTATQQARRTDGGPRLVAISKLHPPSSILAAHRHAEQRHFGENYAQELEAKARVLPLSVQWHFVGKLQSNKAKLIASIPNLFLVETLDSIKLANALHKARAGVEKAERLGVFVQINTSGEENKGGLAPLTGRESGEQASQSDVYQLVAHVMTQCPSLHFRGLMTIGAAATSKANREQVERVIEETEDGEAVAVEARKLNSDFDTLFATRQALVQALRTTMKRAASDANEAYDDLLISDSTSGGLELSMGMSNDLEVAIWAGSTNVRVGTDCFGVRPPSRDEAMDAMKAELDTD